MWAKPLPDLKLSWHHHLTSFSLTKKEFSQFGLLCSPYSACMRLCLLMLSLSFWSCTWKGNSHNFWPEPQGRFQSMAFCCKQRLVCSEQSTRGQHFHVKYEWRPLAMLSLWAEVITSLRVLASGWSPGWVPHWNSSPSLQLASRRALHPGVDSRLICFLLLDRCTAVLFRHSLQSAKTQSWQPVSFSLCAHDLTTVLLLLDFADSKVATSEKVRGKKFLWNINFQELSVANLETLLLTAFQQLFNQKVTNWTTFSRDFGANEH